MQRLNKPAQAPLGTAFFLFLGVAILPISLGAAGVRIGFSPSLSAAADAWQQIAEVLGASYRPDAEARMAALNRSGSEDAAVEDKASECTKSQVAFAVDIQQRSTAAQAIVEPPVSRSNHSRAAYAKSARRLQTIARIESMMVFPGIEAMLEEAQRVQPIRAAKVDTKMREGLLKLIEKRIVPVDFDPTGKLMRAPLPEDLRLLIRLKPALMPTASKRAACRVRAAFSEDRSSERARGYQSGGLPFEPETAEM